MIGQKVLRENINIVKESPLILVGKKGCGKKTLVEEIATKEDMNYLYIDTFVDDDTKESLYIKSNLTLVIFDLTKDMQYKQFLMFQNSILKLLEDTPLYCKFIVLCNDDLTLLNTLINRCNTRYMESYTDEELYSIAEIYNNNNIKEYSKDQMRYINTPLDVINASSVNEILEVEKLVDTILSSIYNANISNVLSISKKFDKEEGYSIELFLNIFRIKLTDTLKYDFSYKYFKIYNIFMKLDSSINKPYRNKVNMLEEFLLTIKYV